MSGPLTQAQKKYATYAGLFLFAVALRAATALAVSLASGMSLRNLTVFFDGHLYLLIARTLPALYSDPRLFFPDFPKDPSFLTGWFPVYPGFIKLLSLFAVDIRLAALLTAWLAGGIAVVLFYELAGDYLEKPLFAAILFSFLPTSWLIGGSLVLVESTYVCLLLACMLAFQRGKTGWASLFAALAVITQKSGFLLLPILALTATPRRRAVMPCISAIAAIIGLQLYLWWLFGDPLINAKVHRSAFGGEWFGLPFAGFITWMLDPRSPFRELFWQRKLITVLEMSFYVFILCWSLFRYSSRMTLFTVWLGIVLLFHASLTNFWSFYAFPRYMLMAGPASIMLACHAFPMGNKRWHFAVAGVLLSLTMLWTVLDTLGTLELCYRVWTPGYYKALDGSFNP